ncbi:hypothetical protein LTR36_006921 [Oleoguttula mirabilis]|uniref:1,3-beta-glucanosyltransferase n=1 Tax=Oleoguttula mirabilis TaxID=1507867 RepID=A0AAV9JBG6_9PEZI|nr:hypothetical protein LTR36_006921 [Oleoguttula mirabilis]
MSELLYYLTPTPASVPIVTRGNAFYRDGERFFVKGISYIPRRPDAERFDRAATLDPLTSDRVEGLEQDIARLHELGLNSISVQNLDPSKDHAKALRLLEKEGIYVVVTICDTIEAPHLRSTTLPGYNNDFDTTPHYSRHMIRKTLALVDQLAAHPNILGFTVSGDSVNTPSVTKIAEVACIRDIKHFLHLRRGRRVPVGVSAPDRLTLRLAHLQYFAAGEPSERADYFAPACWSWAGQSSFQVSGWKHMVEAFGRASPIPMFLNGYGTNLVKPRGWSEVLCLHSPDMTGVFSGGFTYTFFDYAKTGYGVLALGEDGQRVKQQDFYSLEKTFRAVNVRLPEEVATAEGRDYEVWKGQFPPQQHNHTTWSATSELPPFPGDWTEVLQDLTDRRDPEIVT